MTIKLGLLNDVQVRFLCPNDVEEVKRLCREWFPIEWVWILFFYAERELLAGYYQNKHSTKLIAKIKLDLKSQKYFKDEASREHVYCFLCVCVCASYSKHEQTWWLVFWQV